MSAMASFRCDSTDDDDEAGAGLRCNVDEWSGCDEVVDDDDDDDDNDDEADEDDSDAGAGLCCEVDVAVAWKSRRSAELRSAEATR